jgi:signal transduction histidine kinase
MNTYVLSGIITAIFSLILGIFVYFKNKESHVNRTWFLFSLSISIWSFGMVETTVAESKEMALFWGRLHYIGAIAIPLFFFHFVITILNIRKIKKTLFIVYIIGFFFFLSNFTSLLVKDVAPTLMFRYYILPGPIYPFFTLFFFSCIISAVIKLIKAFKEADGIQRNQIKYIFLASIIGFTGGATTFLPVFNIKVFPFGTYFISLYAFIITFAIVKHRLMDISIVIKKGTAYTLMIFLLLVPCVILTILTQNYVFGDISPLFTLLLFFLFLLILFYSPQLKPGMEDVVEQIFFRSKYDYKKTLQELNKTTISILDQEVLLKKLIDTVSNALKIEKISIFLLNEERGFYEIKASLGLDRSKFASLSFSKDDLFIDWLKQKDEIVVKEELVRGFKNQKVELVLKKLDLMESEVCLQLKRRDEFIGIWNLGRKESGDMYSHEDLELLSTLANHATISLQNANFHNKLQQGYKQLSILYEITGDVIGSLELDKVLSNILEKGVNLIKADSGSIRLLEKGRNVLDMIAIYNLSDEYRKKTDMSMGEGVIGSVIQQRKPIAVDEIGKNSQIMYPELSRNDGFASLICVPLNKNGDTIGCLTIYSKSLHKYSHDEISMMTAFANQVTIAIENARLYEDLKKTKAYQRRSDKLASLGTLTAGLAHEIRNPLVAVKTFMQLLKERYDDPEFRESFLDITASEVDRISTLINELLDFARPSQMQPQKENINEIVEKMLLLLKNEVKEKSIEIEKKYASNLPKILVDKEQVKQVFLNMLLNGIQSAPKGGVITVETRQALYGEREFVQVNIRDTGSGIPKEDLESIFDPFFTTKENGTGLGLSISHQIVEEHQGYIDVDSELGKGTTFHVNLPIDLSLLERRKRDEKDPNSR